MSREGAYTRVLKNYILQRNFLLLFFYFIEKYWQTMHKNKTNYCTIDDPHTNVRRHCQKFILFAKAENQNKNFRLKWKIRNSEIKIHANFKLKIQNSKFKIQSPKFEIQNSKFAEYEGIYRYMYCIYYKLNKKVLCCTDKTVSPWHLCNV